MKQSALLDHSADTSAARLVRALQAVGVRPLDAETVPTPLEVRARLSIEDADDLATFVEKHAGQAPTAPSHGEGVFRGYGAGMRLLFALYAIGITLHAKGALREGEPVVRILVAVGEAERLAAFVEEHHA